MTKRIILALALISLFSASLALGYCNGMCGDVTGDNSVDISDVQVFIYCYVNPPVPYPMETCLQYNWSCGDVNNDHYVNVTDAYVLIAYLFEGGSIDCGD